VHDLYSAKVLEESGRDSGLVYTIVNAYLLTYSFTRSSPKCSAHLQRRLRGK